MTRVLIVEDEMLVAADLEATIEDLGYQPIGVAADMRGALNLAALRPDIALVDLHLRDGCTGAAIGARLARDHGVAVVFVTANPGLLDREIDGALGVLTKPCAAETVGMVLDYVARERAGDPAPRPRELRPLGAGAPAVCASR